MRILPNDCTVRSADDFPHQVRHVEHVEIPLPEGHHLAARMWIPQEAEAHPVPAILEYIPYRKRDMTRQRDALTHPYLAGHGYACIRLDMRGSGESSGLLTDQYRPQELEDGLAAIRWIARQKWCDGNVGMMGISWGGFNALQIASLRPPELKAIITACSTDDLYVDNMHYMGGCLLTDNLSEATTMFSINSCPPDARLVGDRWREMWLERLERSGLWIETWLHHQRRDAYWHHGSVCEDYASIQCPVMAIGGWADGFTNSVFRLLEHLHAPRQALLGPWGHKYPHFGVPGPAIGFLQEALRWWDYWLKGQETGIMDEPMLRAWMQDSVPPTTYYNERPGRWVGEPSWPSANVRPFRFPLDSGRILLGEQPPVDRGNRQSIQSPLSVGLFAGKWCSYTAAPDLPHDQREEDGGALVFQSEPLSKTIEILGSPELEVELSSSQPVAMIAVRLSDVAKDDKATRVTYGLLNLTHRDGHANPKPLEPGQFYRVRVPMNYTAQVFPVGHRLRVSISTSYWPLAWPPQPVRLTLIPTASCLTLPLRAPRAEDDAIRFEPPEVAQPIETSVVEAGLQNWLVHRDLAQDLSTLEVIKDDGLFRIEEIDLEAASRTWNWYTELDAWEGDVRIFSKNWKRAIPRDHV